MLVTFNFAQLDEELRKNCQVNFEMDLRSRTLPERPADDKESSDDSHERRDEQPSADTQNGSPTVILDDDDDFNIPLDMGITNTFQSVPQPVPQAGASRDESTPMFRWPMPRRPQPVGDFESPMRRFMEEERYPSLRETVPERSQERDEFSPRGRPAERAKFVTPIVRNDEERIPVDVPLQREPYMRQNPGQSRPGDHIGEQGASGGHVRYERILPEGSRIRGRASAHRPAGYHYDTPRLEYRIPEFLFNEPRPYFPTFSGKHDEWEAFWLKFQLMARRYNWSEEKQQEQLLFCLKEDALNFAATLGLEIRDDLTMFSMALRDRFSHRSPAETVRASLNNIRKSSKESIQEYASRVRAMMTKAYPDIGMSDTINQLTIHHLLQGLPDQSIAYEVLIRKPRTLSEAVDMITWHECCKETTRKKSGIRQLSTFGNEGHTSQKEDLHTLEVRRINGKRFVTEERLIQFVRELKASIDKLLKENGLTQKTNGSYQAEETMPRRRDGSDIICYNCNEPGHISTRYPLKTQENRQKKVAPEQKQPENGNGLSQMAGTPAQ